MEERFRDRVDKVFGSLRSPTSSTAGITSAMWCLTDEEIEKRQWNRNKEESENHFAPDHESASSFVDGPLVDDLEGTSDGEEDDYIEKIPERHQSHGGPAESAADEYLDVKSNIGGDCTLDYEEEEDEYDKVAAGIEETGDRLYMRHVSFPVDEVNAYSELPNTFHSASRDPRANHAAALLRLKEDAEAAGSFDASQKLNTSAPMANMETEEVEKGGLEADNLKPILKRRENPMDFKSQKRVRFVLSPGSRVQSHENESSSGPGAISIGKAYNAEHEQVSHPSHPASGVPDYVRNPSKYTCYTLESSENMDDASNQKAYMEFLQCTGKRDMDSMEDGEAPELPKSIMFTPKKRVVDVDVAAAGSNQGEHNIEDNLKNKGLSIMAENDDSQEETEISAMEEDVPCISTGSASNSGKPGRQYRTRNSTSAHDISNRV